MTTLDEWLSLQAIEVQNPAYWGVKQDPAYEIFLTYFFPFYTNSDSRFRTFKLKSKFRFGMGFHTKFGASNAA